MTTASLENCKELYELSGWDSETYLSKYSDLRPVDADDIDESKPPAYDLGYLLRRLPKFAKVGHLDDVFWRAHYDRSTKDHTNHIFADGRTPEDAACKLAIELIKQGVLK